MQQRLVFGLIDSIMCTSQITNSRLIYEDQSLGQRVATNSFILISAGFAREKGGGGDGEQGLFHKVNVRVSFVGIA